jgi:predicted alpha/beta-hydrolase family hydrolase
MNHPFMASMAAELQTRDIATLRFQFPYVERGSRRPDPEALCHDTVRAVVVKAAELAPALPRFAGGKSFGGRMTSQAQAALPLPGVCGLGFLGFPLHPAGRPADTRARHLFDVKVPMLFLQGTRDDLAQLALLQPVIDRLGTRASLQLIEGADHSYHVRASAGMTDAQIRAVLAQKLCDWIQGISGMKPESPQLP